MVRLLGGAIAARRAVISAIVVLSCWFTGYGTAGAALFGTGNVQPV